MADEREKSYFSDPYDNKYLSWLPPVGVRECGEE